MKCKFMAGNTDYGTLEVNIEGMDLHSSRICADWKGRINKSATREILKGYGKTIKAEGKLESEITQTLATFHTFYVA